MIRRPPRSTRTDTLFPYTTLFRSSSWLGQTSPCTLPDCPARTRRASRGNGKSRRTLCASNPLAFAPALGQADLDELSGGRSEEHTSELQSLMRISYAVFCLKKKKKKNNITNII